MPASKKPPIGVAILAYEGFDDLVAAVRAVKFNTTTAYQLFVFDNSEKMKMIREYLKECHKDVVLLCAKRNVGCSVSRNIMLSEYLKRNPGGEFLCVMDQDVQVKKGWLRAMVQVARAHEDCGIVAWPLANRYFPVTTKGVVSEVASVCNLHRVKALLSIQERWGGPWEERMFMHKFDSLICQRQNLLGWRTYLVLSEYDPNVIWPDQPALIKHNHPHKGVRRNPKWKVIFDRSKRIYADIMKSEGWQQWQPPAPYLKYSGPKRGH